MKPRPTSAADEKVSAQQSTAASTGLMSVLTQSIRVQILTTPIVMFRFTPATMAATLHGGWME
jgi:hypothetical protein